MDLYKIKYLLLWEYFCIVFQEPVLGCNIEMAFIENLPTSSLRGSSAISGYHDAHRSPLNTEEGQGWGAAGWSAGSNTVGQFVEVDLGAVRELVKIATRGHGAEDKWVTSYAVAYSNTGADPSYIMDSQGNVTIFTANEDQNTIVENRFDSSVEARYVRCYPQSWHGGISMRWEVYGCSLDEPLRYSSTRGTQACNAVDELFAEIPNTSLGGSSQTSPFHGYQRSRLHTRSGSGWGAGSWSANQNNIGEFLQANLQGIRRVIKVATQGNEEYNRWVTSYYFGVSLNGNNYSYLTSNDGLPVHFLGNTDCCSVVENSFNAPVMAGYVRIYAQTWERHISMRWEVYGCDAEEWLEHGVFSYYISSRNATFEDARNSCADNSAHLASTISDTEHEFLVNLTQLIHGTRDHWLGLVTFASPCPCPQDSLGVCIYCRKQWMWLDDTDMIDSHGNLVIDKWNDSQPSGEAGEECGVLNGNGSWKSQQCNTNNYYICKIVATFTTTSAAYLATTRDIMTSRADVDRTTTSIVPRASTTENGTTSIGGIATTTENDSTSSDIIYDAVMSEITINTTLVSRESSESMMSSAAYRAPSPFPEVITLAAAHQSDWRTHNCYQKNTFNNRGATLAIDGDTETCATVGYDSAAWWNVQLSAPIQVHNIDLLIVMNGCKRSASFKVEFSNLTNPVGTHRSERAFHTERKEVECPTAGWLSFHLARPQVALLIQLSLEAHSSDYIFLQICEVMLN